MRSLLRLLAFLLLPAVAPAASTISGTVTNGTNGKPAANDTVTLIRLAQGMQEATHTTTDARGHYSLDVPDDGVHLVRVTHDKANYFKPAPPGTTALDIDVYTAAAKVAGVALEADVFRLQTAPDGKSLHVVQHFFLKNESTPPRTQFSERSFEFTLPEGAVVEGAAAQGPGGMTVQSQPIPLPEKGHFSFLFPIRPGGETQFQVTYSVPYSGSLQLAPMAMLPTDNIVVMMPKAMQFSGGTGGFAPVNDEVDAQTYVARSVAPGKAVGFTVSGQGQLPRPTTQPQDASRQDQGNGPPTGTPATGADSNAAPGSNNATAAGSSAADTRPGGGLGNPIDTPDPLSKYKWWIIAGLALLLAIGAGVLLSRPPATATPATAGAEPSTQAPAALAPPALAPSSLMAVLRDELFTLESERLTGRISPEQYARLKPALETVLQHALERAGNSTAAPLR